MWFPVIVLIAQLGAAPAPVQKAYQKLTPAELEAKKTTAKPPKDAHKIDVSAKIRSASFGHKTWLLISKDGKEFWVEYGRSTNTKAALYGPFSVETSAASGPATPQPDTPPPAQGLPHSEPPPPPQDPKFR